MLRKEYDGPKVSPECKALVLKYISAHESVADENILFIKRLTKVASHILSSDPDSLDGLLERLYKFNIEGADMSKANGLDRYTQKNLLSMQSHFNSHAGSTSKEKFDRTGDVSWAEKWYDSEKLSAEISAEFDPKHSAHAYSFTGDAAKVIFEHLLSEGRVEKKWAKRAIKCYEEFIKYYDSYPDSKMNNVITRIRSDIDHLGTFASYIRD